MSSDVHLALLAMLAGFIVMLSMQLFFFIAECLLAYSELKKMKHGERTGPPFIS
jgi:hypothetical protein